VQPEEFRVEEIFHFESRKLEHPGKIYYYNDMLIINEKYEGIHLYDNTDPSNPTYTGFIGIPGNLDVSIRDNILFADSYVDLLSIDISDLENPMIKDRELEVFKKYQWEDDRGYFVYTKETDRTVELSCDDPNAGSEWFWRGGFIMAEANTFAFDGAANINASGTTNVTGQGGSFARFSIVENFLYVLNDREINSFDISKLMDPVATSIVNVDWGTIETLFAYDEYLFIGGTDGMHIYDRVDPSTPSYVSRFKHARACDPVVVQGNTAYVTLRDGSRCESFTNQLDVIDISNIRTPVLIESYDMTNPHGLGVVDDELYICDGRDGLRVFDKSDPNKIDDNKLSHLGGFHAYDIIPLTADHVIVVGDGGLYQYNTSNPENLQELSFIALGDQ